MRAYLPALAAVLLLAGAARSQSVLFFLGQSKQDVSRDASLALVADGMAAGTARVLGKAPDGPVYDPVSQQTFYGTSLLVKVDGQRAYQTTAYFCYWVSPDVWFPCSTLSPGSQPPAGGAAPQPGETLTGLQPWPVSLAQPGFATAAYGAY